MQFVDSYIALMLVLIPFQGLGWTGVGPLVHTKLMVNWFAKKRGTALGIALMGLSVAGVIVPPINAWLAENYGWRSAYLVFASLLVLAVIPLTLILVRQKPQDIGQHPDGEPPLPVPDPTAQQAPDASPQGQSKAGDTQYNTNNGNSFVAVYKEFLTSKAFWSVVLTFGLMNGVYSAMVTHLPTYVSTELNFDIYDGAFLLTISGGFAIAGKVVMGWMMDHFTARLTVMAGVVAYIFSTTCLIYATTYEMLILAAALFGLGFGGMIPIRSVLISRLFGVDKFSRANGLLSFFLAPATFWVLITGMIVDATGSYQTAFQVWTVAFLLAGIVSMSVKLPNH